MPLSPDDSPAAPVSASGAGPEASLSANDPRLRRSLRASLADGLFSEVLVSCSTGAVLTAWALAFGGNILLIGVLAAVPFLAQALHLPAAWVTQRWGRRRVTIVASTLSKQMFLVLVPLPFLDLPEQTRQGVLVAVIAVHAGLGVIANNAWVSWMGDLIPEAVRGRYFGRRHALAVLAGALSVFLAGMLLDHFEHQGAIRIALCLLALTACAAGASSTACLMRQHDPGEADARAPLRLSSVVRPFLDPAARPFVVYQAIWNLGVPFAASFIPVHMIQNLKMPFVFIALHAATGAGLRSLAAPLWGKLLDKVGPRPILVACSAGIVVLPFIWLFPTESLLWPIALDAVISGTLWGGHAVASFALPFSLAPRKDRPFYLAAFAAAGGVCYALGSIGGGLLARGLPSDFELFGRPMVNLHVLFAISLCLRALAVSQSLRIVQPGSSSVGAVFKSVGGGVNARLLSVLMLVRR